MGRQKHIQVLRIEDGNGIGIFSHGFARKNMPVLSERHNKFNTPQEDGLNLWRDNLKWFCAYKSIEQIQQWIMPEEFKKIVDKGYKIYLLTLTKYQMGEHQVIFPKEYIKERKEVTELFV